MKVIVDYLGYIKSLLGLTQPEAVILENDATVCDLLNTLAKIHGSPFHKTLYEPGAADLKGNIILAVNGLLLNQLSGLETKLKDGDSVVLMPIVSGG